MTAPTIDKPKTLVATSPAKPKRSELRDGRSWRVLNPRDVFGGPVLQYPADDATLTRIYGGERIPLEQIVFTYGFPGDVLEDVPTRTVADFLSTGHIAPAGGDDDPYTDAAVAALDDDGRAERDIRSALTERDRAAWAPRIKAERAGLAPAKEGASA